MTIKPALNKLLKGILHNEKRQTQPQKHGKE
jgi:hypothetical protein